MAITNYCLLLALSFQIICFVHNASCQPAEEQEDPRKPPRLLCSEPGCNCNPSNQDQATHVSCDCLREPSINNQPTFFKFSAKMRCPPTLQNIRISNCDGVDWDETAETFRLNLTKVLIENVGILTISPSALKIVSNLIISNVTSMVLEDKAFDKLVADNVIFQDVGISGPHAFRPLIINSKLEFQSANITNDATVEINQENSSGLTVSFRKCEFDELPKSKIKADHIEIMANNYKNIESCSVSPNSACQLRQEKFVFGKSLDIKGNTFNNLQQLPDIYFSPKDNDTIIISLPEGTAKDISMLYLTVETWLAHFNLRGANKSPRVVEQCREKVVWNSNPPENKIICPSPESLINFITNKRLKSIYDRYPKKPSNAPSSSSILSFVPLIFTTYAPIFFLYVM